RSGRLSAHADGHRELMAGRPPDLAHPPIAVNGRHTGDLNAEAVHTEALDRLVLVPRRWRIRATDDDGPDTGVTPGQPNRHDGSARAHRIGLEGQIAGSAIVRSS